LRTGVAPLNEYADGAESSLAGSVVRLSRHRDRKTRTQIERYFIISSNNDCMASAHISWPLFVGLAMGDVHVYNNLFTRVLLGFGFGGLSEPAVGAIHLYRNIMDQRCPFLWTRYREAYNEAPGGFLVYDNGVIVTGSSSSQYATRSYRPLPGFSSWWFLHAYVRGTACPCSLIGSRITCVGCPA
jgi:hypothetical protein